MGPVLDFAQFNATEDRWETIYAMPVANFDEATLRLSELLWEVHGDIMTVIEYDMAFRDARERLECLCGRPGCGNVILPVKLMDGTLAAITYVPAS